ncbi:hypothetical protein HY496_01130 [Candidatus Woesearchaeota archaeon]|nr:hypothetical protein [Candidatus Woesearchaeota archaeon]
MKSEKIWSEYWAEAFSLFFLVLGLLLAIGLRNPLFSYFTVFLSGGLAGRIFYQKRFKEPILPFILIILGFLVGYLIGSFWTNRLWSLMLFSSGFLLSYYLHLKNIFVIFKSQGFVK